MLRRFGTEWRYLLLRTYGNWEFPKGQIEPGEEPLQAALRETAEETTLTGLAFDFGEDHYETAPYSAGKIARYYVAMSAKGAVGLPINPELGRPEHDEFRWVGHEAARRLLPPRLVPVLDWAREQVAVARNRQSGAQNPRQSPALRRGEIPGDST